MKFYIFSPRTRRVLFLATTLLSVFLSCGPAPKTDIQDLELVVQPEVNALINNWVETEPKNLKHSFFFRTGEDSTKELCYRIDRATVNKMIGQGFPLGSFQIFWGAKKSNFQGPSVETPNLVPIISLASDTSGFPSRTEYHEMQFSPQEIVCSQDPIMCTTAQTFKNNWVRTPIDAVQSQLYPDRTFDCSEGFVQYFHYNSNDTNKILQFLGDNENHTIYLHLGAFNSSNPNCIGLCTIIHLYNPDGRKNQVQKFFEFSFPCPKYCGRRATELCAQSDLLSTDKAE